MPIENDFQLLLGEMCKMERQQAELFQGVLDQLEDPDLRAVFERLHRDEVDHEKALASHVKP